MQARGSAGRGLSGGTVVDLGGLADKAKNLAAEHSDKVDDAVDKVADAVGDKVGHQDKVDMFAEKIKDALPDKQ
jgi:hypothetical protein